MVVNIEVLVQFIVFFVATTMAIIGFVFKYGCTKEWANNRFALKEDLSEIKSGIKVIQTRLEYITKALEELQSRKGGIYKENANAV